MKKQPTKRKKAKNLSYNLNKKVLPVLVKLFKTTKGKSKSVNQYWIKSFLAKKLQVEVPSRITRRLIHHIRVNGLVKNLIAFSNGYYIATTPNESATYIKRVGSHIKELQDIKKALTKQHKAKYPLAKRKKVKVKKEYQTEVQAQHARAYMDYLKGVRQ